MSRPRGLKGSRLIPLCCCLLLGLVFPPEAKAQESLTPTAKMDIELGTRAMAAMGDKIYLARSLCNGTRIRDCESKIQEIQILDSDPIELSLRAELVLPGRADEIQDMFVGHGWIVIASRYQDADFDSEQYRMIVVDRNELRISSHRYVDDQFGQLDLDGDTASDFIISRNANGPALWRVENGELVQLSQYPEKGYCLPAISHRKVLLRCPETLELYRVEDEGSLTLLECSIFQKMKTVSSTA